MTRSARILAVMLAAALGVTTLGSCSDDGDGDAGTTTVAESSSTGTGEAGCFTATPTRSPFSF